MVKKRKGFFKVFFQKWIGTMFICFLLGGLALGMFVSAVKNQKMEEFYQAISYEMEDIAKMTEDDMETFDNRCNFRMGICIETFGVATALYDSETKEKVAGCEEKLFAMQSRTKEHVVRIYALPTKQISGWKEHREKLMANNEEGVWYTEILDMPYLYWDGQNILPGAFSVRVEATDYMEYVMSYGEYEWDTLFVSQFEDGGEIPEGYERVEIGERDFTLHPVVFGYSADKPWQGKLSSVNESYAMLTEVYENVKASGGEHDRSEAFFTTLDLVAFRDAALVDGRTVTLVGAMHYDVLKVWGKAIIIAVGVLFVLGSVLALILAKLSYANLKAGYAMEDYRKQLMNTMAHDLKSPLMSISGYAENLNNHLNPDKQEYYAQAILGNVQYMNSMIEAVLNLSKMEQGAVKLKQKQVDVAGLVQECLKKYELQIKERKLQIEVAGEAIWQADERFLLQALDNLIGNAVKYSSQGGTIKIILEGKKLEMSNPCEEDLSEKAASLCEPFVVGDESRSGRRGSGLGLAIVKQICELQEWGLTLQYEDGQFRVIVNKGK